ncbi:MAG: cell division protein ZapA [Bacillota bacterium]
MSHNLNKVEVCILDDRYVLKGTESQEYMEMLAFQLDKRLKKAQDMNPRLNTVQTVVLTAVNLLDELIKLQQEYQAFVELADEQKEKDNK